MGYTVDKSDSPDSQQPRRYFPFSRLTVGFERTAAIGAIGTAFVATLVVYFLHLWMPEQSSPGVMAIRERFLNNGIIPYVLFWMFTFGMVYLLSVWNRKVLSLFRISEVEQRMLRRRDAILPSQIKAFADDEPRTYYRERLLRLSQRWQLDPDLSAVIALKNEMLDCDEQQFLQSFQPVRMAEWALPLIGFIGTVVGISQSMGGIQKGIQVLVETSTISMDVFGQAFQGLALAFDTTLLGLLGLLLLGGAHAYIRKKVGDRLVAAGSLFSDIVAVWIEPEPATIIYNLEEITTRLDRFGETALHVIEEAEGFEKIRSALFRNVVTFDVAQPEFLQDINEFAREYFEDDYLFIDCSVSEEPFVVTALINHEDIRYVIVRDSNGDCNCHQLDVQDVDYLELSGDAGILLSMNYDERIYMQRLDAGTGRFRGRVESLDISPTGVKSVLSLTGPLRDRFVVSTRDSLQFVPDNNGTGALFPANPTRSILCTAYSAESEAIGSLYTDGEKWGVKVVRPRSKSPIERAGYDVTHIPPNAQKLALIHGFDLLLSGPENYLHFWSSQANTPLRLTHPDWRHIKCDQILAGAGGWIAVAQAGSLSMWRISPMGTLSRAETPGHNQDVRYALGGVDPRYLKATPDGKFVVAPQGQHLIAWSYPQTYADLLARTSRGIRGQASKKKPVERVWNGPVVSDASTKAY